MKPRFWVSQIKFSDDTLLDFDKNDIVVFVGPNNSGKSETLREVSTMIRQNNSANFVVKNIKFEKEGTKDDLLNYLENFSRKQVTTNPYPTYSGFKFSIYGGDIENSWNADVPLKTLAPLFINLLSTEDRLLASNPAPNIALTSEPLSHPIHFLQRTDSVEKQFSDYFRQAFGMDLIVHRNAGNIVPLYVGQRPIPAAGEDRVSENYIMQLEKLSKLKEQGDGMRAFVGILLDSFIESHSVLLIDEPEAFLHPPQARILGKMLAKNLPRSKQLFLATHSANFIRGLLDEDVQNLKIIRIKRNGNINNISELNKNDINILWNDPLLRHSNILEGLFHTKVIVCESDSDCRFYLAVLDAILDEVGTNGRDFMFTHCGGKHRIASVVKALKKLDIPVSVIADFDVLNDIEPLKGIIESLGGDWTKLEPDWSLVKREIEQKRPELNSEEGKREIKGVLDGITEAKFPTHASKAIQNILRKTSAWAEAKHIGLSFVPSGHATQACNRVFQQSRSMGLFIVENGELESFAKSIGNHGPKWVNEVLTKDIGHDPELETARKFINDLIR